MKRIAVAGGGWAMFGRGAAAAVQLGGLVLLAQFLTESDFGLAGMVAIVTGLLGVAADLGMDVLIVQRTGIDDRRATRLAEAGGLVTALVVFAFAPLIARAFGDPPILRGLLRGGAMVLLLAGMAAPARARLRREFHFARLAMVDGGRALVAVGVALFAATRGHGPWSLVLGDVCATGLAGAAAWLVAPPARDGPERALLADGVRIVGTRAADAAFAQADRYFVGARLGAGALGFYHFAWRHAMALVQHVMPVAEQVALPIFSRLQHDRPALVRAYLGMTRTLALVLVPSAILLWGCAGPLVDLLYPDRWRHAVPGLRALCLAAAAAGLNSDPGLVWIALGRMRLRLLWALANLVVLVPIVWVGTRHGVVGVAYALAARSIVATLAGQIITKRVAGVPHLGYVRALLPATIAGALLAVALR